VVRVVLLFYLMPVWALLLSRTLLGEHISARGLLRVALALAGALVVLWPQDGQLAAGTGGLLPDVLGVAGGFFFALNNVMLRREAAQPESARALAMFFGGTVVSLALAAWLIAGGLVPAPPPLAWAWGLPAAGLTVWFLASNLTLQYGAARLPANTTALVMLSEVVFASGSAVLLGAGTLGARELLGAAMILGGALLAVTQRD
jgi:drug/metabolite transporter (DMT)-like permease